MEKNVIINDASFEKHQRKIMIAKKKELTLCMAKQLHL